MTANSLFDKGLSSDLTGADADISKGGGVHHPTIPNGGDPPHDGGDLGACGPQKLTAFMQFP